MSQLTPFGRFLRHQEENIEAWLKPDPKNLDAMQAILEDRALPEDEHGVGALKPLASDSYAPRSPVNFTFASCG
jgi:hypothetical protein